jgi:hypothetical protein
MAKRKRIKKEGWYDPVGKVRRGLPQKTFNAVNRDCRKVLAQHLRKDEDGDYPVDVTIYDRTRLEPNHFEPLERWAVVEDQPPDMQRQFLVDQLRTVQLNQALVAEQSRRVFHQLEDFAKKGSIRGCGCKWDLRPDHEGVMHATLWACEQHDTKFKLEKRDGRKR